MNALSEHIESLLLDHDCVVLPQFGAFVTQKGAAARSDEDGLFFPPLRVVRFHPGVTEDDGLLASRMKASSETEAKRRVQELVLGLRQQLLADGQVEVGSLGQFLQDEDGHVSFEACQAGAMTPLYYGLDAFSFPKLSDIQHSTPQAAKMQREALRERQLSERQDEHSYITIRISRATLNYVAAVAAVVCICLMVASPLSQRLPSLAHQAHFSPFELSLGHQSTEAKQEVPQEISPKKLQQAETAASATHHAVTEQEEAPILNSTPMEEVPSEVNTSEELASPLEAENLLPHAETQAPPKTTFCIVLASAISSSNADNYVKVLHQRGMIHARCSFNGKMRRVILDGYASESEAQAEARRLHDTEEFASAWVMQTPKE